VQGDHDRVDRQVVVALRPAARRRRAGSDRRRDPRNATAARKTSVNASDSASQTVSGADAATKISATRAACAANTKRGDNGVRADASGSRMASLSLAHASSRARATARTQSASRVGVVTSMDSATTPPGRRRKLFSVSPCGATR
jgi:hypothetical protein